MREMEQEMSPAGLQVGSVLSRPKGPVMHRGIYLGNGWVFENTWKWGERISTFGQFAGKHTVTVERVLALPIGDVYTRVKARLGRRYCLFTNNCDHAVARVEEGAPRSAQLLGITIAAVFAAVVLASVTPPSEKRA
jgi:hypothetical protein